MAENNQGLDAAFARDAFHRHLIKTAIKIPLWLGIAWAVTHFYPGAQWVWYVTYTFIGIALVASGVFAWLAYRAARAERAAPQESEPEPPAAAAPANEEWTDESRADLRETIRRNVAGEVRLMKSGPERILDSIQAVYLDDGCPAEEQAGFLQLAADELEQAASRLAAEQRSWPADTDSDRLDRAEAALRDRGVVLWQVSPCCNTCTVSELPDRIETLNERVPGFAAQVRGYAYFIEQNMADELGDGAAITVYLGYGWFSPEGASVEPEVYEQHALNVAHEVCDVLRAQGLAPDWDGDFAKKIGLSLQWQRRTLLT